MKLTTFFTLSFALVGTNLYAPPPFSSSVFHFADVENAKGCHVVLRGQARSGM